MARSREEDGRRSASIYAAAITGEDGVDPLWPGYHILRELGEPDGTDTEPAEGGPFGADCW